jgi:hypothetical protein
VSVPPPLSVSQVPKELVESPSRLCPTADPTASLGPGLAGRVCSTYCPSLPLSTYLTSRKPHFSLRVRYFVHVHAIIPSRFRHTHPHAVLVSQPLLLRAQLSSAPPAFPSRPAGSFTSLPGTSFVSALPLSYCTYPWPPPLRGPCFYLRLVPDYVCKYYYTYIVLKHGSSTSR